MRAYFFAFEGCDACGKTTQSKLFGDHLVNVGHAVRLTREPGDTPAGQRIRALLLDHSPEGASLHVRTEALLMAADRAQHVAEVVQPSLAAGVHVITDRFLASSVSYQGYARGLDPRAVRDLSLWAGDNCVPDLQILIRVPAEMIVERLAAGGNDRGGPDRLESEGRPFFERVIAGYDAQVDADPDRWLVVDGVGSIAEVSARVRSGVAGRMPELAI